MIRHKLESCSKFDIAFKRVLTYDNESSDGIPLAICTVQAAVQTWWETDSAQHHVTQTGSAFAVKTMRDVNNVAGSFVTREKWFILNSYDLWSLIYKAPDYLGQDSSHLILTKLQARHLKYLNCLESCHQWRRTAPPDGSPAYSEIRTQAGSVEQPQAAWWCGETAVMRDVAPRAWIYPRREGRRCCMTASQQGAISQSNMPGIPILVGNNEKLRNNNNE